MDEIENPFETLHHLMDQAREMAPSTMTLDVWATVLKCPASNSLAIAQGLNRLVQLIEQSRRAIAFIPGDRDRFQKPIDQLEQMLKSQNLTRLWNDYRGYLDPSTMTALDFGTYALTQFYPGASPEKSIEIRQFMEKLDELLAEALDSDLPEPIKKLFVKHLEALRSALLRYRMDGPEVLEDALNGAVGAMQRNAAELQAQPKESRELFQRFWDLLSKVNDIASGYQNATDLLISASPLLLPLIATGM